MAAYPSFITRNDSRFILNDGRELVRATNQTPKIRLLANADKLSIQLVHSLSAVEFSTLQTFYDNNKTVSFTYTDPWSNVHTCIFGTPWVTYEPYGAGWLVRVNLEEV